MAAEFRLVLDELPEDFVDQIARARETTFSVLIYFPDCERSRSWTGTHRMPPTSRSPSPNPRKPRRKCK
jgi:hypothetical protein